MKQAVKEIKHGIIFIIIMVLIAVGISLILSEPLGDSIGNGLLILLKLLGFGCIFISRYLYIIIFEPKATKS